MSVTTATVEANSVAEAVAKVDEIHKAFGTDVDIDLAILAEDKKAAVLGDVIENVTRAVEKADLGYAFPWLKGKQEENIMAAGAIQFEEFTGLTSMPQKAASAWAKVDELVGADYLPLLYVGTQVVRGLNHWFIAQVTTSGTANPKKKIVKLAVNEFQGKFEVVGNKIETIFE